jgi:AcrR family transcriptional regulator
VIADAVVHLTPCSRKGRPRDERLDDVIVASAIGVLADVGFDRFSVEEVAQRAGVAKTTIYRRFPSRNELITGALGQIGEECPANPLEGSVRSRLVAILTEIRESTPDSTRGRILMHAMSARDPGLAVLVHDRVLSQRSHRLRAVVAEGISTGELRDGLDVDAVMSVLVGPMLYLGMWRMRAGVDEVSVDDVVELLMTGLTRANGW